MDASNKPFYSPALMAYLRGVGMSLSMAEDNRATAQGQANRDYQRSLQDTNRNYTEGRRNMTADLVSRGILRSGEANDRYTKQDDAKARETNRISTSRADRMTAINKAYHGVEDTLRQQTVERMLTAEQEAADRAATAKAQQDQADALTKFYQGK
jgi:hypothetical protein